MPMCLRISASSSGSGINIGDIIIDEADIHGEADLAQRRFMLVAMMCGKE
jgi:hypothetical protein